MTDFPSGQLPLFIHPWTNYGCCYTLKNMVVTTPASMAWTANQAIYMPVTLPWAYPVARVWWANGSTVASANCDFGIYSGSGSQIYHTGSTVQAGASLPQFVTPTVPFTLPAGRYYFAWVCDATTNHAFGVIPTVALSAMAGMLTQATALPLPATATFATMSAVGPALCGITRTAVGTAF